MVQAPASNRGEMERAELDAVLRALTRTPRLANLLSFVAERYFGGRTEEITEYNIATEVFARSKTTFDPSQDSIVRVEAYRLRKRLREYYTTEGSNHELEISLPSGSYTPSFATRSSQATSPQPTGPNQTGTQSSNSEESTVEELHGSENVLSSTASGPPTLRERYLGRFGGVVAALAVLILVLGAVIALAVRSRSAPASRAATAKPATPVESRDVSTVNARGPVRILAGYQGTPRIDSTGAYWEADRYVEGGAAFRRPGPPVARSSDPMLFDYWRTGDFEYKIPLQGGPWELHLFFVASQPEDINQDTFHVAANWKLLLPGFNISSDALGVNIADERVFRDVYPTQWGYLSLKFTKELGSPSVSAIELLPGIPHKQLPIRLVMQKTAVTDHEGNVWHPDNYYQNGVTSDTPRRVGSTADPDLYAHERYGHFTYSIPVDPRDRYSVVLHFAELYWGPKASGSGGVGSRVFRVICNGSTLLDRFDLYKEAGTLNAVTKTFSHLRPSPEGKLDLTFEPIVNFATVSAIEVIDEAE
ncbi:malectin [Occallatibacter riparius]|uniref:Malectin n=1 Tax=Occallatibacter riparius TaxID=1002689 RepID=A0A9J7BNC9_9BACT|nr:malectin [Occallatibacter riparius]UWZ84396.1 malectin [Occallatibacter riparius]